MAAKFKVLERERAKSKTADLQYVGGNPGKLKQA